MESYFVNVVSRWTDGNGKTFTTVDVIMVEAASPDAARQAAEPNLMWNETIVSVV